MRRRELFSRLAAGAVMAPVVVSEVLADPTQMAPEPEVATAAPDTGITYAPTINIEMRGHQYSRREIEAMLRKIDLAINDRGKFAS